LCEDRDNVQEILDGTDDLQAVTTVPGRLPGRASAAQPDAIRAQTMLLIVDASCRLNLKR
jgi:hypothetical protein